ncbi:hypothetical protein VCR12J2_620618 [Vibrio coralliirubri]|nr:hypothetical protein VCR12J2_620618 [Vibrio coralliirubri]
MVVYKLCGVTHWKASRYQTTVTSLMLKSNLLEMTSTIGDIHHYLELVKQSFI